MSQFAIIGFGSLIWDPQVLSAYGMTVGRWKNNGPVFPLEFSRISPRRLGALTLVIDHQGVACQTYWIKMDGRHWDIVHEILARREGKIDVISRQDPAPPEGTRQKVWDWLADKSGITHAVWTSQVSNFAQETGTPFSVTHALNYLLGLKNTSQTAFDAARTYIHETPEQTQTPLRLAFEQRWPRP